MSEDADERPFIEAVFSSQELQQECVAMSVGDFWAGEPIEVDALLPKMRDGMTVYEVTMTAKGEYTVRNLGGTPSADEFCSLYKWSRWLPSVPTRLVVCVRAKDEESAVAYTRQKREEILASGGWPTDPE